MYTQTTLGELTNQLFLRLSAQGFWTMDELQGYVKEALRTWQAFSQSYTIRASIYTTPIVFFYDLFKLIPALNPSITDRVLIVDIQRSLQEPVSPISWIGTEQFSFQQVINAIQRARNKFLLETGMVNSVIEISRTNPKFREH